jgi:hypothetical protein
MKFQERPRSLLNAMIIQAAVGQPMNAADMARALRIKGTVHALKRNGPKNINGRLLRLFTVINVLKKDLY